MKFLLVAEFLITFIMCKSIEGLVGQLNDRLAGRLWLLGLSGAGFEHASILGPAVGQGNMIVVVSTFVDNPTELLRQCRSSVLNGVILF